MTYGAQFSAREKGKRKKKKGVTYLGPWYGILSQAMIVIKWLVSIPYNVNIISPSV